jgi:hypothetical protein
MPKRKPKSEVLPPGQGDYGNLLARISSLLEQGRRASVRITNAILTATYWEVGRQIVEFEQGGRAQADYGDRLLKRLGQDLAAACGRGLDGGTSSVCEPSTSVGNFSKHRLASGKHG